MLRPLLLEQHSLWRTVGRHRHRSRETSHLHTHASYHVCTNASCFMHAQACTCAGSHTRTHIGACLHTRLHMLTCTRTPARTPIHTRQRTAALCTHTHTQAHPFTRTRTLMLARSHTLIHITQEDAASRLHRFYVPHPLQETVGLLALEQEEGRHAIKALRLSEGCQVSFSAVQMRQLCVLNAQTDTQVWTLLHTQVELCDGRGWTQSCTITAVEKSAGRALVSGASVHVILSAAHSSFAHAVWILMKDCSTTSVICVYLSHAVGAGRSPDLSPLAGTTDHHGCRLHHPEGRCGLIGARF